MALADRDARGGLVDLGVGGLGRLDRGVLVGRRQAQERRLVLRPELGDVESLRLGQCERRGEHLGELGIHRWVLLRLAVDRRSWRRGGRNARGGARRHDHDGCLAAARFVDDRRRHCIAAQRLAAHRAVVIAVIALGAADRAAALDVLRGRGEHVGRHHGVDGVAMPGVLADRHRSSDRIVGPGVAVRLVGALRCLVAGRQPLAPPLIRRVAEVDRVAVPGRLRRQRSQLADALVRGRGRTRSHRVWLAPRLLGIDRRVRLGDLSRTRTGDRDARVLTRTEFGEGFLRGPQRDHEPARLDRLTHGAEEALGDVHVHRKCERDVAGRLCVVHLVAGRAPPDELLRSLEKVRRDRIALQIVVRRSGRVGAGECPAVDVRIVPLADLHHARQRRHLLLVGQTGALDQHHLGGLLRRLVDARDEVEPVKPELVARWHAASLVPAPRPGRLGAVGDAAAAAVSTRGRSRIVSGQPAVPVWMPLCDARSGGQVDGLGADASSANPSRVAGRSRARRRRAGRGSQPRGDGEQRGEPGDRGCCSAAAARALIWRAELAILAPCCLPCEPRCCVSGC